MRIVEGFVLRDVLGQATIVGEGIGQINYSKLITLNESAAYLWRSVEGKEFEAHTLALLLKERYGIDLHCAERDAQAILEQWIELKMVEK